MLETACSRACCTAATICLWDCDKLRHNRDILNAKETRVREQLGMITAGFVFAFLGAIVVGII